MKNKIVTAQRVPIGTETEGSLPPDCMGVVMPVFNEVATVEEILTRVLAQPCVREVVAVDDGSVDGTWEILARWPLQESRVRVIRHLNNRGKGAAVRTGIGHVQAPVVIIQDADLEYDPADYERLLVPIRTGKADVVYGSRFAGRRAISTWWHQWGNSLLTCMTNACTGLRLTDEATCYKVFRRDVLVQFELEEDRFGFCPEITAKLAKARVRLCEVPIAYRPRPRREGKKIRFRDGLYALLCLLRYSPRGLPWKIR